MQTLVSPSVWDHPLVSTDMLLTQDLTSYMQRVWGPWSNGLITIYSSTYGGNIWRAIMPLEHSRKQPWHPTVNSSQEGACGSKVRCTKTVVQTSMLKTALSCYKTFHCHPHTQKVMLTSFSDSPISTESPFPWVSLRNPPRTQSSPSWFYTWGFYGTWRDSWSSSWLPRRRNISQRSRSGSLALHMSSSTYKGCMESYSTPVWWFPQEGPTSYYWKPCSESTLTVLSCHITPSSTLKKISTGGKRHCPSPSLDAPSLNPQPSSTFTLSQT